MQSIRTYN